MLRLSKPGVEGARLHGLYDLDNQQKRPKTEDMTKQELNERMRKIINKLVDEEPS